MKNLFVSFSGGETSGLMARLVQTKWRSRYASVINVFANTGEENEATLRFVRECDEAFGLNVVWVEAAIDPRHGYGTTHKIVTFETASRHGEPYEAGVLKYGIPNAKYPWCTRELKQKAMYSYVRSLGWGKNDYEVAIGIRADEASRRVTGDPLLVYPLLDWLPLSKPDVNTFWRDQPFRLQLTGYQGNCKTCWKKSTRKLLTVMDETPQAFDFFERLEATCGEIGPEFAKGTAPGYKRVFFRNNTSAVDLRKMHMTTNWQAAENDAVVYSGKVVPLDADEGCVESCEVKWEDPRD